MIKRIGTLIWFWSPAILWMGLIFYSSSLSAEEMPVLDMLGMDRLFHFIEYFILGFLLARALRHTGANFNYTYIFITAILTGSIYGLSDEFHQRFVPGRSCDIFDFLSDLAGSIAGAALFLYKEKVRNADDKAL